MTTAKISFCIDTTDSKAALGVEVWIDDQKIADSAHVIEPIKISQDISDDEAPRQLKIVLKNKLPEHTKIDEQGNIVQDSRLLISQLMFDEIELGQLFYDLAVYEHDCNGTSQPVQEKFYGEMGCNGTVTLNFSTPIYLWLLENM